MVMRGSAWFIAARKASASSMVRGSPYKVSSPPAVLYSASVLKPMAWPLRTSRSRAAAASCRAVSGGVRQITPWIWDRRRLTTVRKCSLTWWLISCM